MVLAFLRKRGSISLIWRCVALLLCAMTSVAELLPCPTCGTPPKEDPSGDIGCPICRLWADSVGTWNKITGSKNVPRPEIPASTDEERK
jgi:uncharacterized Zn finger protein (UPF0148 family)